MDKLLLEEWMKSQNLRRKDLAKMLNVSYVYLSRLLINDGKPSYDLLLRLQKITGLPYDSLIKKAA